MKMRKGKGLLAVLLAAVMLAAEVTTGAAAENPGTTADEKDPRGRVVGYFPSYRYEFLDSIDFSAMTHVILSFVQYQGGNMYCMFDDTQIRAIKEKCDENGVKLMIALGGDGGFAYTDNPIDTDEERTEFINELMYYVDTYDLDGIDIDVEITNADFWKCFDGFTAELSGRLKAEEKLLTMAVAPWFTDGIAESTYDYFDFINLMSYDSIDKIGNQVLYYEARGISKEEMNIGVPFFGVSEDGKSYYSYAEIIADHKTGVSYDGIPEMTAKAEYSLSYGGIMIWEIGQDVFEPEYSLLEAIKKVYFVPETGIAPVTELVAENITFTGTRLEWAASEDAVCYTIFNGQEYIGSTADTSYQIAGLTDSSLYTFKVYAVNQAGVSSISANVNVETPMDASELAEWNPNKVYLSGNQAVHNGAVYTAQWWTSGNEPGSTQAGSGVWLYVGKAGNAGSGKLQMSVRPDKIAMQEKGTTINFSAVVSGGTDMMAQRYYYIVKDGAVVYENTMTGDMEFAYTFAEAGDYRVLTYCKDAERKKASGRISISIEEK